jgi:hypothetical protein
VGMKMKKVFLIILTCISWIICSQPGKAQEAVRETSPALIPQGFGIPLLNATGVSGIVNDISNVSYMNPASLFLQENYSFGLSYQFQTSIDEAYVYDIGTSRIKNYIPQSIGGVAKYYDLSFGMGFIQKYNGTLDFDPIPITTIQEPDGTGEFFVPVIENILYNYSFSACYQLTNIFTDRSNLSFGVKYILNSFYGYESVLSVSAESSLLGSTFEFGSMFNYDLNEFQSVGLSVSFSTSTEMSDVVKFNGTDNLNLPDSGRIRIIPQNFIVSLNIPSELNFDIYYKPINELTLLGRFSSIFWSSSTENVKDQLTFSSSASYTFNPSVAASFGIHTTSKKYVENIFNLNDNLYAFYFTAGLSFKINILKIDLALADSHLFSGDMWKQTIGKVGLGIQL